ncbi:cytochrome P450 4c21-like isoform X1 [Wyeomyia smithii]|uniref:cytochrome P450 4c21-like isoform X1 n=1 Tax=Wyeomyia smithii TaxID=174621 RepID=UPI002467F561|nr:cytochrome P450 4c21-like isoform X1 [Wyeomyia smithii]
MITITLLAVFTLSYYLYFKIRYRFAEKIPAVEPLVPFFGNGLDFFQKNAVEIWESLSRPFFDDEKRIFKLSFGPIVILCINHPDLFQKVIMESASMEKPYVYNFLRVERGLLLGQYDLWKVHRKVLNPTFNSRILNSFIPIFTDCVDKMIKSIEKQWKPGQALNIIEFTSPCTLSMICRTSLGGKVLEREGTQEFVVGLEAILRNVGLRMFNANLHPDIVYRFTRFYRYEMEARKFCYAFTDKIIHEKRAEFAKLQNKNDSNNNPNGSPKGGNKQVNKVEPEEVEDDMLSYKKPQIFIDQLMTTPLPDGKMFTHEEITDHIYTMIAAGNETSATQAAHTALLLAMHPEIQERAMVELREVFPTRESGYNPEVLKQLVYMDRIIKESQRLAPVAAVFGRQTLSDLQLDEFVIPKGNIFILNIFALHRRKEFWGEDAEEFNPDRFLPEETKKRHPFAYLPFSAGPRGCIGSRYATMSLKTIISELLRNYKLTTDMKYQDIKFKFKVSMHLATEHRVFLEPRNMYPD